jgi:hypothetical protein
MMKRFSTIAGACIVLAVLAAPYSAFSAGYRMPVRENLRPLSLAPNSLKLDLGLDFAAGADRGGFALGFIPDLLKFTLGYFKLGERCEMYWFPYFKYYFLKNTEIRDSCMVINGPNFAVSGGISVIEYSSVDGYNMTFEAGHQYKTAVSGKGWIFSRTTATLDMKRYVTAQVDMGFGWQLSDKLFIRASAGTGYRQWYIYLVNHEVYGYGEMAARTEQSLWSIQAPVDLGINFSAKNSVLFRTGYYRQKSNFDEVINGVLAGFQYSHIFYLRPRPRK